MPSLALVIIDLVTVFDAILTSRQTREKLKRLFRKKFQLQTKATKRRIVLKHFWGATVLKFIQRLALDFLYICL